ncbi:hypothetical protein R70006_08302 [Paraburkholderia domus]|nr:hypothetical protein R70006_08302 [Paraburkholderia domus]CAE6969245.1 hypothetical protein R75471_07341 [Paraburkholderia domus]
MLFLIDACRRQIRLDDLAENLAELDAPLIERIDVPHRRLHQHLVLIQRDQCAERTRGERIDQQCARRTVARKHQMRRQFRLVRTGDLLRFFERAAQHQRFALRETVRQQLRMMADKRMLRRQHGDEVDRHDGRTLVQHLEERMLSVRARFAPGHSRSRIVDHHAIQARRLAVALHLELLQVRRQEMQRFRIRRDQIALRAEEVAIPDADHAEQHG